MAFNTDRIRTVADYTALKSYSNFDEIVYVTDQGFFEPKTTGDENGGTIIRSSSNLLYRWHRIIDGPYRPEWWVIGEYSDETDDNLITNSRDQLAAATSTAPEGAIIQLEAGKTYEIDIPVPFKKNQTITGGTIKRADAISSALGSDYGVNDTTVTVADGSLFRLGQGIAIVDTSLPNGGFSHDEYFYTGNGVMTITAINGNDLTVNFSGSTTAITAANGVVYTLCDIFDPDSVMDTYAVRDTVIDGNATNNPLRSWKVNSTLVESGNGDSYGTWDNVYFIDLPCENYIGPAAKFIGCRFLNLQASLFHASNGSYDNLNPFIVDGCYGKGFNIATDAISGHSESIFTMSAIPLNLTITNSHFEDGAETILGGVGGDNLNIFIDNCSFKNFYAVFGQQALNTTGVGGGDPKMMEGLKITNTIFENCGDGIMLEGGSDTMAQGYLFDSITFTDNTIYNGRWIFSQSTNAHIANNKFLYSSGRNDFAGFSGEVVTDFPCYVGIVSVDRFNFINNIIEGPTSPNTDMEIGLYIPVDHTSTNSGRFRNTAASTPSSTFYGHGINISNNFIFGFTKGISTRTGSDHFGLLHEGVAAGWNIKNNTIITDRSGSSAWTAGIIAEAGMVVDNNTIYFTDNTTGGQYSAGIWALGLDGGSADAANHLGCIVTNNKIIGPAVYSIFVGSVLTAAERCAANNVVKYNMGFSNPVAYGPAATLAISETSDNIVLNSTLLTDFTTPALPELGGWQENTGYY
jgi:hypothetical protein